MAGRYYRVPRQHLGNRGIYLKGEPENGNYIFYNGVAEAWMIGPHAGFADESVMGVGPSHAARPDLVSEKKNDRS